MRSRICFCTCTVEVGHYGRIAKILCPYEELKFGGVLRQQKKCDCYCTCVVENWPKVAENVVKLPKFIVLWETQQRGMENLHLGKFLLHQK